jgi:hypothetical protein
MAMVLLLLLLLLPSACEIGEHVKYRPSSRTLELRFGPAPLLSANQPE